MDGNLVHRRGEKHNACKVENRANPARELSSSYRKRSQPDDHGRAQPHKVSVVGPFAQGEIYVAV